MSHGTHGIRDEDEPDLVARLGISEHSEEDCRVSEILTLAWERPVWVEGAAAWVAHEDAWVRYRISASDRRRLLLGKGTDVYLDPWDEEDDR